MENKNGYKKTRRPKSNILWGMCLGLLFGIIIDNILQGLLFGLVFGMLYKPKANNE